MAFMGWWGGVTTSPRPTKPARHRKLLCRDMVPPRPNRSLPSPMMGNDSCSATEGPQPLKGNSLPSFSATIHRPHPLAYPIGIIITEGKQWIPSPPQAGHPRAVIPSPTILQDNDSHTYMTVVCDRLNFHTPSAPEEQVRAPLYIAWPKQHA